MGIPPIKASNDKTRESTGEWLARKPGPWPLSVCGTSSVLKANQRIPLGIGRDDDSGLQVIAAVVAGEGDGASLAERILQSLADLVRKSRI